MITVDFKCDGCGKQIIAATFKDIWYVGKKRCHSPECARRVIEAIRGVKPQDLMRQEDQAKAA